ncbi:MAG TPA: DUF6184 family natural product biosynthesis lipoprotein [Polyangiaceae bacterium]|nr:DUF6184 family natural product biosynthesis lipoprotein [Polyangiaceae bacterium]
MNQNIAMLVASATLALACSRSSDREPETASRTVRTSPSEFNSYEMTPASGTRPAADQIARARCDREQKCSNIGADKTYSSMQDCLARIQNDWKDDLNARECPGGINQHELDECMGQIRAEACGNPFDTLARITECTQGQICIERP